MSQRRFLTFVILAGGIAVSLALINAALATSAEDIEYPVSELGSCKNETECRSFCAKSKNIEVCLDFAEEHNLIPAEELAFARKFAEAGQGPGGCTTKESCENYCNDVANIEECLAFAEEHDIMPPEELEEAKKVKEALEKGAKLPGGCRNKKECENYCADPGRMEECIAFAEAAGFIPEEELEEAKKVLEAIRQGAKPPPCRGKAECDSYCAEPNNFEECITFAEAAGFVSPEEAAMARKTGGKGPGGCRGRDECEQFCEDENNMPACIEFAAEHGLMSEEEVEMARKTGGKGPGGCKGRESCETFCQNPANQEICFNFAKEHGLISEEDMQEMEQGRQQMMEGLTQAPPEVEQCLSNALGSEAFEGIKAGTTMPSREIGDKIRQCFEEVMRGGMMGPGGDLEGQRMPTSAGVSVKTGQLGLDVMMRIPGGIKEFSIQPEGESSYGGGVPDCPREFKAETRFTADSFPLAVAITDCNDEKFDFSVTSEGNYRQGGEEGGEGPGGIPPGMMPPGMAPPERMMPPGFEGQGPGPGFSGPGGCRTPEECTAYCQSNPEECRGFGPPSGGEEPGHETTPGESPMPPGAQPGIPPDMMNLGQPPTPEQLQQITEQQTQQQFQQQFQQQMQQQIQQQMQQAPSMMPPAGTMPPEGIIPSPTQTILPPPPAEQLPPLPPSSQNPLQFLLGTILAPFVNLIGQ